jgi:amino acid adenylation domain-containing protein
MSGWDESRWQQAQSILRGPEIPIRDSCLPQLIQEQAERAPERVAVTCGNAHLTYAALNARANKLAHYLRRKGVGPEVRVGLGLERSLELVFGILAVWKAGGAYVPVDPDFPRERLNYMMQDSGASVVLTRRYLRDLWGAAQGEVVDLDHDWPKIERESWDNPRLSAKGENLAQVLYTSGSAGKPKGVEITHGSLLNFLESLQERPGISERDVVAATTTACFDTSGVELFMPLTAGARIVLVDRNTTPREFFKLIGDESVTVTQGTPTILRLYVECGWRGKGDLKIISGGEELKRDLAEKLISICAELWNIYGPTEATIWATIECVQRGRGLVPIGQPIANTQIHILGKDLKPVPPGVTGELYIGGAGLARGYVNRPELTAERFIVNPLPERPGSRIYRTGDLARYLRSGTIEFLGRADHQIKINGARIEPGEIESAILEFPQVRQAVVVAREDAPGEKRLVAYVIMRGGTEPRSAEMRTSLANKLPRTMIPSAFVALPAFPQTPNGKINREALPRPELQAGRVAY